MADGRKAHPETDTSGDTTEFAAVEPEQPDRVCYELRSGTGVSVTRYFRTPIEIRVGETTESSPLFVHQGSDFPKLCEADGKEPSTSYVLIQPDVFTENPALGWMAIDRWTAIGRSEAPQFRLGRDISREGHIELGPGKLGGGDPAKFEIVGCSASPTKVIVDSREHRLWNYEMRE